MVKGRKKISQTKGRRLSLTSHSSKEKQNRKRTRLDLVSNELFLSFIQQNHEQIFTGASCLTLSMKKFKKISVLQKRNSNSACTANNSVNNSIVQNLKELYTNFIGLTNLLFVNVPFKSFLITKNNAMVQSRKTRITRANTRNNFSCPPYRDKHHLTTF